MLFKKYSSKAEALVLIQTKLNVKLNEEIVKGFLELTFNFKDRTTTKPQKEIIYSI